MGFYRLFVPVALHNQLLGIIAGTGSAGDDDSLLAYGKVERGQFHDLPFIDASLKDKIKIREQFTLRQL